MIVAVHALIGATLSRLCQSHGQAFLLGAASHLACDLVPHRDLEIPAEAALLAGALGALGLTQGFDSREFAGAVGAAAPDIENLIGRLLGIPDEKLLLPTHSRYHGRELASVVSQVAIAAACAVGLARGGGGEEAEAAGLGRVDPEVG
jgi:hypothetical protein